jgi:hypothetical protein
MPEPTQREGILARKFHKKSGVAVVQKLQNETAAFRSVDGDEEFDLASGRFDASTCSAMAFAL